MSDLIKNAVSQDWQCGAVEVSFATGIFLSPPPLPTADPHIAGRMYVSAGTVKISAG